MDLRAIYSFDDSDKEEGKEEEDDDVRSFLADSGKSDNNNSSNNSAESSARKRARRRPQLAGGLAPVHKVQLLDDINVAGGLYKKSLDKIKKSNPNAYLRVDKEQLRNFHHYLKRHCKSPEEWKEFERDLRKDLAEFLPANKHQTTKQSTTKGAPKPSPLAPTTTPKKTPTTTPRKKHTVMAPFGSPAAVRYGSDQPDPGANDCHWCSFFFFLDRLTTFCLFCLLFRGR